MVPGCRSGVSVAWSVDLSLDNNADDADAIASLCCMTTTRESEEEEEEEESVAVGDFRSRKIKTMRAPGPVRSVLSLVVLSDVFFFSQEQAGTGYLCERSTHPPLPPGPWRARTSWAVWSAAACAQSRDLPAVIWSVVEWSSCVVLCCLVLLNPEGRGRKY